jgi:hypothetical protein
MVGRPKIRIPKANIGYIARATIVNELTAHLEAKDIPLASNKARSTISDFKKYLDAKGLSKLVLNNGISGKELYPTQELGMWLYNRGKAYNGFTSSLCPFVIPIVVNLNNQNLNANISIGQVVATGASSYEELLEEMRTLTAKLVEKDLQLQIASHIIQAHEEKSKKLSARNSNNAKKKRPRSI